MLHRKNYLIIYWCSGDMKFTNANNKNNSNKKSTMNANNNTLGLNSEVVAAILTIAATLQGNYEKLGATAHQNVRNPFPMQKLVINALPTSMSKALTRRQIRESIRAHGYRVSDLYIANTIARLCVSGAVQSIGNSRSKFSRFWFAI